MNQFNLNKKINKNQLVKINKIFNKIVFHLPLPKNRFLNNKNNTSKYRGKRLN